MSSIQEIHKLEERIYDIVQDYVNENYNEYDVLVISDNYGIIDLEADCLGNLNVPQNADIIPLRELIRTSDDNMPEPDIDKISDIANIWLKLE